MGTRELRQEPIQDLSQQIAYPTKNSVSSSVDPDATYVTSVEIERAKIIREQAQRHRTPDTFVIVTSHVTDRTVRDPNVFISRDMTDDVTHLVVPTDKDKIASRTIKLLQAILMGKWIVSQEWITACCEEGRMIPVDSYLAAGVDTAARSQHALKRAREHLVGGGPRLFEGICFYLYGEFVRPTKVELATLIRLAGGRLVESPDQLRTSDGEIICAPITQQTELRYLHHTCGRFPVTPMWIMDSVSSYYVQSKQPYYAGEISNSVLSRE
ncbi:hypothetical protein BX666DRAFT_63090 [Dichotomocladium elegans]|nr:hypothetical protein BX666DRAFT_63090 [Dichotomocladium elegans]